MMTEAATATFTRLDLDSGATLAPVEVAYETYGTLNAEKSNAILIAPRVFGRRACRRRRRMVVKMIGPGKGFDTDRYFVICSNILGGCRGTTGPGSINPETGCPWAMTFPVVTCRRHGAAAEDADRLSGHPAAAGGCRADRWEECRRSNGRWRIPDRVAAAHADRDHGAPQRAADRVQRSGPPGDHGRSRLERRKLLWLRVRRRAGWRWRGWSATSPT